MIFDHYYPFWNFITSKNLNIDQESRLSWTKQVLIQADVHSDNRFWTRENQCPKIEGKKLY